MFNDGFNLAPFGGPAFLLAAALRSPLIVAAVAEPALDTIPIDPCRRLAPFRVAPVIIAPIEITAIIVAPFAGLAAVLISRNLRGFGYVGAQVSGVPWFRGSIARQSDFPR